jgi:hypothetical protein
MFSLGKKTRQLWIAAGIALGVMTLGACSGGGGGSAISPMQPAPQGPGSAPSKSVDIPWSSIGSAISLPSVAGYNESITLTDNSLKATSEKLTLTISTKAPKGVPAMPASMHETQGFLSFSLTSSKDVKLSGFPGFSLTVPPGMVWDGGLLHLGFYDPASGWVSIGDVNLKGTTMTFTPNKSTLNLKGGVQYVVLPFACTVPSPSPSPTPSGVVSCAASGTGAIGVLCNAGKTYAFVGKGVTGSTSVEQINISSGPNASSTAAPTHTYTSTFLPEACTGDEKHLVVWCTSFASGKITTINAAAQTNVDFDTGATGTLGFSGGSCVICAIAYDRIDNAFIIEDKNPTAGGGMFQRLPEAAPHTIDMTILSPDPNENPGYDYVKNWIWNPEYNNGKLEVADFSSGKLFTTTNAIANMSIPDSGTVDVATHVAETPNEFDFTVTVADLGTATMSGSTLTVTTGQTVLTHAGNELDNDATATDSVLHLTFLAGEFGTNLMGFALLPTTSTGTAISDWAYARFPNTPDGGVWSSAFDPHPIAAFNDPTNCPDCALSINNNNNWLAVIDLNALSHAKRSSGDPHAIDPSVDLLATHVLAYYKI